MKAETGKRKRVTRHRGHRLTKSEREARRIERLEKGNAGAVPAEVKKFEELIAQLPNDEGGMNGPVLNQLVQLALPFVEWKATIIKVLLECGQFKVADTQLMHFLEMDQAQGSLELKSEMEDALLGYCSTGEFVLATYLFQILYKWTHPSEPALASFEKWQSVATLGFKLELVTQVLDAKSPSNFRKLHAASYANLEPVCHQFCDNITTAICGTNGILVVLMLVILHGNGETVRRICQIHNQFEDLFVTLLYGNPAVYRVFVEGIDHTSLHRKIDRLIHPTLKLAKQTLSKLLRAIEGYRVPSVTTVPATQVENRVSKAVQVIAQQIQQSSALRTFTMVWKRHLRIGKPDQVEMATQAMETQCAVSDTILKHLNEIGKSQLKLEFTRFGSFAIPGLASNRADLDISVRILGDEYSSTLLESKRNSDTVQYLSIFKEAFEKKPTEWQSCKLLERARVPILKLLHVNGLHVDVCVGNEQAIKNTQLVALACAYCPLMLPLLKLVRFWSFRRRLVNPRQGLNSHAWTVMVMFFLQNEKLLPWFNRDNPCGTLSNKVKLPQVNGTQVPSIPAPQDVSTVFALLIRFWDFYCEQFSFPSNAVDLSDSNWKDSEINFVEQNRTCLKIRDPHETERDLGFRLSKLESVMIEIELLRAGVHCCHAIELRDGTADASSMDVYVLQLFATPPAVPVSHPRGGKSSNKQDKVSVKLDGAGEGSSNKMETD